jgi:hypothetical protein
MYWEPAQLTCRSARPLLFVSPQQVLALLVTEIPRYGSGGYRIIPTVAREWLPQGATFADIKAGRV